MADRRKKAQAGVAAGGRLYSRAFGSGADRYKVVGEIAYSGSTVTISNLTVARLGGDRPVSSRSALAAKNQMVDEFKTMGFKELRIMADRISGANPNRAIDIVIDLTK